MEKRQGSAVIFFREGSFSQDVGRGPGKVALRKFIEDRLEISAGSAGFVQRAVGFAEEKESVRAPGRGRVLIKVFFKFRNCEVVLLLSEQAIGVLELPLG